MQANFNATCSSHMPILLAFIEKFKPKKIIEFGSGYFSTKVFRDNCEKFKAVEITSRIWFNIISKKYKREGWEYKLARTHKEAMDELYGTFDLIFVDCSEPRIEITNASFYHTENLIVHDTQLYWTKKINVPNTFRIFKFKQFPVVYTYKRKDAFAHRPWTTLFTSNREVIKYFKQLDEKSLYYIYRFPYGVTK